MAFSPPRLGANAASVGRISTRCLALSGDGEEGRHHARWLPSWHSPRLERPLARCCCTCPPSLGGSLGAGTVGRARGTPRRNRRRGKSCVAAGPDHHAAAAGDPPLWRDPATGWRRPGNPAVHRPRAEPAHHACDPTSGAPSRTAAGPALRAGLRGTTPGMLKRLFPSFQRICAKASVGTLRRSGAHRLQLGPARGPHAALDAMQQKRSRRLAGRRSAGDAGSLERLKGEGQNGWHHMAKACQVSTVH